MHRVDKSDFRESRHPVTRWSREYIEALEGDTYIMHVPQILPIALRGASLFQGPTQMTRVNRLASWWWSYYTCETDLTFGGSFGGGARHSPNLRSTRSNKLRVTEDSEVELPTPLFTSTFILSVLFKPNLSLEDQVQSIILC